MVDGGYVVLGEYNVKRKGGMRGTESKEMDRRKRIIQLWSFREFIELYL